LDLTVVIVLGHWEEVISKPALLRAYDRSKGDRGEDRANDDNGERQTEALKGA
jgi:hypothetical protein